MLNRPRPGWQNVQWEDIETEQSFVMLEFYTVKEYHFKEMNANYQLKVRKR